jgi:phosphatidylserine/phosphatidylglycerophosphate/cardiolipin synthase-like enzyme
MSHLKGLLIDGAHLVVGSSNFDFVSLAAEEELLAVISRPEVITDFQRLIIAPAVAGALPAGAWRGARWAGRASELALRLAERVALAARGAPRTAMDWPV